jgi:serine/threonine-protein kinase HipA
LTPKVWILSPAFDINPIPGSTGLHLNISERSNALDHDLAREVAEKFRINANKREEIIRKISKATALWKELAVKIGISRNEMQVMEAAFHNL